MLRRGDLRSSKRILVGNLRPRNYRTRYIIAGIARILAGEIWDSFAREGIGRHPSWVAYANETVGLFLFSSVCLYRKRRGERV